MAGKPSAIDGECCSVDFSSRKLQFFIRKFGSPAISRLVSYDMGFSPSEIAGKNIRDSRWRVSVWYMAQNPISSAIAGNVSSVTSKHRWTQRCSRENTRPALRVRKASPWSGNPESAADGFAWLRALHALTLASIARIGGAADQRPEDASAWVAWRVAARPVPAGLSANARTRNGNPRFPCSHGKAELSR